MPTHVPFVLEQEKLLASLGTGVLGAWRRAERISGGIDRILKSQPVV